MRKPEEIQQEILTLMNELFESQNTEIVMLRDQLTYVNGVVRDLKDKNKEIAKILIRE